MAMLRVTIGRTPESEYKGRGSLKARQCGRRGIRDREVAEPASRLLAGDQARDALVDDRAAEPAAVAKLLDECIGDELHRPVDQDDVVGRALAKAVRRRALDDLDAVLPGYAGQRRRGFDGDGVDAHFLEHRGRISRARTDDERTFAANWRQGRQQKAEHGRSGKRPALAQRDRAVDIGQRLLLVGHEPLTRDQRHGRNYSRIAHALGTQLGVDHRLASSGIIGNWGVRGHIVLYYSNTPSMQDGSYQPISLSPRAANFRLSKVRSAWWIAGAACALIGLRGLTIFEKPGKG